jgi:hypothetical protein
MTDSIQKGQLIVLLEGIKVECRDEEEEYFLAKGEIFESQHNQPRFMEYLHVWCNKRKLHFTLPMNIIK